MPAPTPTYHNRVTSPSKNYQFDIDTKIYASNITANGGTISLQSLEYVNSFIIGLKNSGLWNKIQDCGIFCGDNLSAALVKLKNIKGITPVNLINNNFISSDYNERGSSGGLQGNGTTKSLNTTLFSNNTGGTKIHKTDVSVNASPINIHVCVYAHVLGTLPRTLIQGGFPEVLGINITSGVLTGMSNNNNQVIILPSLVSGTYISTQLIDTSYFYINGNSFAVTNTGIDWLNNTGGQVIGIFARAGSSSFANSLLSFYSIGLGLTATDATNLSNLISALQTQLGR